MDVKEFIEKAKEVIELYNVLSLDEFEDAFSADYPEDWKNIKCVSKAQEQNNYHWYSTATSVYMLENGFVGITAGYKINSEIMDWSDTDDTVKIDIYEAYPTIAYRKKLVN